MNNNHFLNINKSSVSTLKSNNFKQPSNKKQSIEKLPLLEIAKYSDQLIKNSESKESIIRSKKIIENISTKSTYYDKIDMLNYTPKKKEVVQKYLKSFTTLDIPLSKNKHTLYVYSHTTIYKNVFKILEYSFFEMSSVISQPYFYVTPKNVVINLFYYVMNQRHFKKNFLSLNIQKLQGLSTKLSQYFKKPIKLELTQLYSVSHNSQILTHIFGKLGVNRRNSFSRIIGRFLNHQSSKIMFRSHHLSKFTSILTGVNIKLGGRLMKGKIVPRRTVKKIQYGSLARSKSNYITIARLTQKNKRGSFSFTVSMAHKFF